MSYETSPILNRIKIRKGWKTSSFPLKTLHYSHEIILWFKLYLLLKNYLFLQKIMVLSCEIRFSEDHKKILYLSITKQFQKKKLPKSKWKSASLLRESKSLLTKIGNKKARFLLYHDLKNLKKNSSFFLNPHQKKILSKAWIAKPRFSSWINLTKATYFFRKKAKSVLHVIWKKKKNLSFPNNRVLISKNLILKNSVEKKLLSKQIFWRHKQRKVLGLLSKTQKKLVFLEKNLALIAVWHINRKEEPRLLESIKKKLLKNLLTSLTFKYTRQKNLLKKIRNLYDHVSNPSFSVLNTNLFRKKIQKRRKNLRLNFFWPSLKKKLWISHIKNLSFANNKKILALWTSDFFKKTQNYRFLNTRSPWSFLPFFAKYTSKIQPLLTKKFISKKLFKKIWRQDFQQLSLLSKTKFLMRKNKVLPWHLTQLLRFKHQAKSNFLKKKTQQKSQKKLKSISKKKTKLHKVQQYRLPFTLLYKNHLSLWTGFRINSLLQNLIQKYFGLDFTVKISWPLIQFKNLNFYRLLFPVYKASNFEDNFQDRLTSFKLKEKKNVKRNRYLYVGQQTKHLQLQKTLAQIQKKSILFTKIYKTAKILKKHSPSKILYGFDLKSFKKPNFKNLKSFSSFQNRNEIQKQPLLLTQFQRRPSKKNPYLLAKSKNLQKKSQKRLFWAAKTPEIGNFLNTLTLFAKYLDPQPLADHLAKLISQSKNHSSLIKFMEKILHTVQMKRAVGYRIALIGRIDGANKSRTVYLKKLNRSRARQNFSKNVNFAMSHARATIGVFNIKIWIYF